MINPISKGHNYSTPVTSKKTSVKTNPDTTKNNTSNTVSKPNLSSMKTEGLIYSPVRNSRPSSDNRSIISPTAEGPLGSMSQIRDVMNAPGEKESSGTDKLQDRINNIKANPNTAILQAFTNKQSVIDLLA
ncbi:MAG: hypothetical protein H6Q59_1476 [Firmicutes bacterium]|nr:hypothetical protein [Bacillota bacterium]